MTAPRLVILDPDLSLGRTLIRVLREHGFDVVAVPDVSELEAAFADGPTELLLVDIVAAGEDAASEVTRLRAARVPAPGLLVLSSRPPEADVYRALETGPQDFIAKPFRVHELVARVKAQLRARQEAHDPQAGRVAPVSQEDLEDLASQKALELLLRAEEGAWDPGGRPDHEVAGYVSKVARHALVDLARRRGRESPAPDDPEAWATVLAERGGDAVRPEDRIVAQEFARALRACVAALAPRAQLAWYHRVFLERPSREIAADLGLSPAHVDVVVQRARAALRACMEQKGHRDPQLRAGAFVELWRHFADTHPMAGHPREDS